MNQHKIPREWGIKKNKGIPSWPASLFFKPSRNSVTRREESQALAINKIVQPIPPTEEEAIAAVMGAAAANGATVLGVAIVYQPILVGHSMKISYKQLCCQNEDQS
jgi:hypothetical protein